MKPTKILSTTRAEKGIIVCICNNGKEYTIFELSKIIGIQAASLRQRIKNWGYDHPDIFRAKSPCKVGKQRDMSIKLDIEPGDLEGKYTGKKSEAEVRKILDNIPSPTKYEKLYC
jgi:hypothetical protein